MTANKRIVTHSFRNLYYYSKKLLEKLIGFFIQLTDLSRVIGSNKRVWNVQMLTSMWASLSLLLKISVRIWITQIKTQMCILVEPNPYLIMLFTRNSWFPPLTVFSHPFTRCTSTLYSRSLTWESAYSNQTIYIMTVTIQFIRI